jgi:hypothetical protein
LKDEAFAIFEGMVNRQIGRRNRVVVFIKTALMFFVAFLFFKLSFAAPFNPNPSEPEVISEIQRHQNEILEMALHLFQNFPEQFPSLNRLPPGLAVKLLTGYFKFHDAPKLWELEKLREFGFSGFEKPLESIRKNWGQTLPEADRGWIDSMNEVERVYKTAGLHRLCAELGLQLVSRLWRELLAIEDLVDVLDTKLNRTYEVTGSKAPPKPFAAEEYIRLVRKNIFGALLIREFEISWKKRPKKCSSLFNQPMH